ncbi:MAG: SIMPL domain-containing protein [Bacillota bacterium]
MKPQHFAALAGSLLVMALILLLAGRPLPAKDPVEEQPPRTVTVLGEGEMRAKPDQVILTFGVSIWTQGASAAEAEALHLASVTRLTAALRKLGLSPQQIQAEAPVVTPLTRQDYAGKTYLTGFQAEGRVAVTLTALERVEAVIAAGLANGATGLYATAYGLQDAEEVRREAVRAAIASAESQAAAIVQGQDRTLGALLSVEVLEEESPTQTPSSPGDLIFRARVRATYEY